MAVGMDVARGGYCRHAPTSLRQSGHCHPVILPFSKTPINREWKAPGSHVWGKSISLAM